MKPRHTRIAIIVGALAGLGVAAGLVLNALQSNVAFFFTPTQVIGGEAPKNKAFRVGGMVRAGSIKRDQMTAPPPALVAGLNLALKRAAT